MDEAQIAAAKERAAEVVNGFKTVRMQNARDALALAQEVESKSRVIDALRKRMLADELMRAANGAKGRSPLDEFFKGLGL